MKTVVYTVITGSYDEVKQPKVITDGVDYVIFTDNDKLDYGAWMARPIPEELEGLSDVKKQRCVKINAHRYLPEYDFSIYVDGAVEITGDLSGIIEKFSTDETKSVWIPAHPNRKCAYSEAGACAMLRKDSVANISRTVGFLKSEGFPKGSGLVQSNVIFRRHNEDYCVKLMEKWWDVLSEYSHRDQLSFNYSLWKTGSDGFSYLPKTTCETKPFKWMKRHKKSLKQRIHNSCIHHMVCS